MPRPLFLPLAFLLSACGTSNNSTSAGDGDGDTNGDGDLVGDGDGDTSGDGDGDLAGDGDGDVPGDGDAPGDGDGDTGDGGAGSGGGDGDTASGGAGGDGAGGDGSGGGPSLVDAQVYCDDACSTVTPAVSGCSDMYICNEGGQCEARADRWNEQGRDAFEWCLENDYLCFTTAEGCMLDHVFGQDTPITYRALGSDLALPDGTKVGFVLHSDAPGHPQTTGTIQGGSFAVEVEGPRSQNIGRQSFIWVDQDGDGVASEGDFCQGVYPEFHGDFDDPAVVASLDLESESNGISICMTYF